MNFTTKFIEIAPDDLKLDSLLSGCLINSFLEAPGVLFYSKTQTYMVNCFIKNKMQLVQVASTVVDQDIETELIFETSGTVYKLSNDGSLYRLLSTACSSSSGEIFGSDGSKSEGHSWMSIESSLPGRGSVVCAAGSSHGYTVLHRSRSNDDYARTDFYLSGFAIRDTSVNIWSTLIENAYDDHHGHWYLQAFKSQQLSPSFLKHLVSSAIIVDPDILVVADPCGVVSMIPLHPDLLNANLMPLHYDNGKMVCIDVTPCGQGLLFIYENGKIVVSYYSEKLSRIEYQTHFLSTPIISSVVYKTDGRFSIVWSDGVSLHQTCACTLPHFVLEEKTLPIKGIVKLFPFINNNLLGFSNNQCFYEIQLDLHVEAVLPLHFNLTVSMDERIQIVGKEVEAIKDELNKVNNQIEALEVEQIDPSKLRVQVEENLLKIENLSPKIIPKIKWPVYGTFSRNGRNFVTNFFLNQDLEPQETAIIPFEGVNGNDWDWVEIDLVSYLNRGRQLVCRLGRFPIVPGSIEGEDLCTQILKDIF